SPTPSPAHISLRYPHNRSFSNYPFKARWRHPTRPSQPAQHARGKCPSRHQERKCPRRGTKEHEGKLFLIFLPIGVPSCPFVGDPPLPWRLGVSAAHLFCRLTVGLTNR